MGGPVLVINLNSNPAVTAGLDAALVAFRLKGGPPTVGLMRPLRGYVIVVGFQYIAFSGQALSVDGGQACVDET